MTAERRVATITEILAINKKLVEVCRKTTNGYCEYIDRHITDQTIAAEFKAPLAAVQRIRRDQFGHLRLRNGEGDAGGGLAGLRGEVAELRQEQEQTREQLLQAGRVIDKLAAVDAATQRAIEDIIDRFHKLTTSLALNRVADVKHLGEGMGVPYRNGSTSPPQHR
jgi:hypothetical protein